MIDKLIFDDLDPWVAQYNKNHGRNGRFAGKSGGAGIPSRAAGRKSSGGSTRTVGAKQMRAVRKTKTTQTVQGVVGGKVRSAKAVSRNGMLRDGTKTYTYKVSKGGFVRKTPGKFTSGMVGPLGGNSRFRPGSPVGGNKNVRYISRAHMANRAVNFPHSAASPLGRAHSAYSVRKFAKGRPLNPGYVVSYGKPIPVSTGN
jgi:hypothetical protein